jgi:hypothetical protein
MSVELIATCKNHKDVVKALNTLLDSGISREFITVLGKGFEDFEVEKENEDIAFWGKIGAGWGAIVGLLVGAAVSFVPGFGPIVGAGPLISSLAGALGGAAVSGSVTALVAWMVDLGIEEEEALHYQELLKKGHYLIIIEGKPALEAKKILNNLNICEVKTITKE